MTTLFRLNLDKNTGVFFDDESKTIKKFYIGKKANILRKNEITGFKWYSYELKKKNIFSFDLVNKNKKSQSQIEYPLIRGKKYSFWKKFINNVDQVHQIVKHYKFIWPDKKYVPYHGDLTLENIIFISKNKTIFIDWEDFKKKELWGLDICYFLISLVTLPLINSGKKKISSDETSKFKYFWKMVFNKKKYIYLKDPVNYLKKKYKKKNHFIHKIDDEVKEQIKNIIKII